MKHQTLDQLHAVADVHAEATDLVATRSQRLERWAKLLEQNPDRRLEALTGTEYKSPEIREKMRYNDSPLTVAFEDPIFRAQGLRDDTYGEARRFFEPDRLAVARNRLPLPCRRHDTSAVGCLSRPCGNVGEVRFLCLAARNIHALKHRH